MNAFQLPEFLKTLLSTLPVTPSAATNDEPKTAEPPPTAPPSKTDESPQADKENRFLRLIERHESAVKKIGREKGKRG